NIYQCPKVSRSEREEGCEELPSKTGAETVPRKEGSAGMNNPRAGAGRTASEVKNIHPTVKPIKLMRWLARLVMPPGEDAVLLDTFAGSGSTLVAAEKEGFNSIGIEMNPEYVDIIRARLSHACKGE
ncbi:MAG: site-specific DNA-methyltransferase, partial [Pseudomonadota bacterium]|nr:site-specific DNA-methyltransferase [Pseudomonadota bacterium]